MADIMKNNEIFCIFQILKCQYASLSSNKRLVYSLLLVSICLGAAQNDTNDPEYNLAYAQDTHSGKKPKVAS